MGVIKRQAFKTSLASFIGVAIGVLSTLFIYTKVFNEGQNGQINFIQTAPSLLVTFASLGLGNLVVRFFPTFNTSKNHNGYLGLLISILLLGITLYFILSLTFFDFLPEKYREEYVLISVMVVILGFRDMFTSYAQNFRRTTMPAVFDTIFLKAGIPVLAILYFTEWLNFRQLLIALVGLYGAIALGLAIYIYRLGHFHIYFQWDFFSEKKALLREMVSYALYGILGAAGGIIALQINSVMITELIGYESNGVYAIVNVMANVIGIPYLSMINITSPIAGDHIQHERWDHVKDLYQRSSINLLIVGSFILVGLWSCLEYVFDIMPNGEKYAVGKYVILFAGIGKLFDMGTSINGRIIGFTKYYRLGFYTILFLAVLTVSLNSVLIPMYGIEGAAFGTMLSSLLFNLFCVLFVWIKFKIQPFNLKSLQVILLSLGLWGLTKLIPDFGNPFLDIAFNALFITVFYVLAVLKFRLSDDLSDFYRQILFRLKRGNFKFW
ncbi:MAG TPA: oligosaccharide flippase family protein [Haliscomenobacter sp.]|nr:oligosaccharide flippase family protein [Haliscomenobacter sp.]